mmetsp:Transcript_22328/g.36528  ORF Transcript_22328/g.36528 Transcript_22328/m.36528 type:complete len:621 (+) Transcript_22328:91-1953(+)
MSPSSISTGGSSRSNDASTSSSSSSTAGSKEVDGKALAIQLAGTLFELSLTLAASYYFSRWLAKKIQGDATNGMDGYTDEAVDGGSGGPGVIPRLRKLLAARHEATLIAMMDELEDHQLLWKEQQEEKKQESNPQLNNIDNDHDEQMCLQEQTKHQYAQLEQELIQQHERSLSTLNSLSSYEMSIAQTNVIDPSNLSVHFSDIGGMDNIKSEIYDLVVLPLLRPDLFLSDSGLVSPPKGILLYGPPGTGKTMLAKAIAKESHATFVNVQLSTIMNKWFGESNKLISAVFGLARKLAPSVVFIDEMDAFLSQRDGTEGSAVNSMKSEFLTLWDGLLSERPKSSDRDDDGSGSTKSSTKAEEANSSSMMLPTPPIIVLGATNRPYDVDPAILRRLPRSFEIALPNHNSRLQLLRLFLEKQHMTPEAKSFLPKVAEMTIGYSGSDLKEVCRAAAWEPVREMTSGASRKAVGWDGDGKPNNSNNSMLKRTSSGFPPRGTKARPVNKNDFILAVQKVKKTGESARDFHKKEVLRGRDEKMAMAADIRNTPVGGGGPNAQGKRSDKKKTSTTPQSVQPMQQIDIQEIMKVAMAAAASMNNQGYVVESSEDGEDDDSPPEIFVDANM